VVLPLLPVIAITFGLILCKCQVAILLSASCVFSTTTQILSINTIHIDNVTFRDVCTDTRKRMDGALFIALCGDNFDAHDYVKQEMIRPHFNDSVLVFFC
jgi:UDP-N-acetylmuramyl pentapeptide synthase